MSAFLPARRFCIWLAVLPLMLDSGLAAAKDSTEKAGDVLQIAIPAAGLAGTLFYEKGWDGTVQFAESLATSQVIAEILKDVVHERRPNGGCCKSFPSGHTTAAFMGATFIHERYGLEYAIPAYVAATFVGYSRVEAKKHYVHDVAAGAALGSVTSYYFTKPYKGFTVVPVADGGFYGAVVSRDW
ncbi:MAG TPA: phosphatase PAP2 family protein [Thiobacillaceae bacterium]|nr:phosphatase PAP2 family protein [Thiobacillaceae bacterium]